MKPEFSSLMQKFQTEYTCPITHEPIKNPVITIDGLTYQKESLEEWFKYNNIEPQTKRQLFNNNSFPNIALKNLINKINHQVPKLQLHILSQQARISQLKEELQELKQTIKSAPQLSQQSAIESSKKNQSILRRKKMPIHKRVQKDTKVGKNLSFRQKLKQERALRLDSQKIKVQLIGQLNELQQKYDKSRLEQQRLNKQKDNQIKKINRQLQNLKEKYRWARQTISKITVKANSMLSKQSMFDQMMLAVFYSLYKTKIYKRKIGSPVESIEDIRKSFHKMLNQEINDLFQFHIRHCIKAIEQGRKTDEDLKIIEKNQEGHKYHWQLIQLKFHSNEKFFVTIEPSHLSLSRSPQKDISLGINIIPCSQKIQLTDYKHIDWNEFSSFYGISTTDNQFQLFVKNYKKQFKSLRSVTFKNPAMTKIYLRDLRKLSKLKFVKFRFRDNLNSNLFNRLTRILESKPELRSYVSIKVD